MRRRAVRALLTAAAGVCFGLGWLGGRSVVAALFAVDTIRFGYQQGRGHSAGKG